MADEPLSLALKRGHIDCAEILVSSDGIGDEKLDYYKSTSTNPNNVD